MSFKEYQQLRDATIAARTDSGRPPLRIDCMNPARALDHLFVDPVSTVTQVRDVVLQIDCVAKKECLLVYFVSVKHVMSLN